MKLDHIDLGPAKPSSTIPGRVLEYLRETDRIIETTLAPAALLSARFGLLPEGTTDVTVELNIHADGGLTGIPRETLNLVVLEGLRQLGFSNVDVNIEEKS